MSNSNPPSLGELPASADTTHQIPSKLAAIRGQAIQARKACQNHWELANQAEEHCTACLDAVGRLCSEIEMYVQAQQLERRNLVLDGLPLAATHLPKANEAAGELARALQLLIREFPATATRWRGWNLEELFQILDREFRERAQLNGSRSGEQDALAYRRAGFDAAHLFVGVLIGGVLPPEETVEELCAEELLWSRRYLYPMIELLTGGNPTDQRDFVPPEADRTTPETEVTDERIAAPELSTSRLEWVDGQPPPELVRTLSPAEKEALTTHLKAVVELRGEGEETKDKNCHDYAVKAELTTMTWLAWSRALRRAYKRLGASRTPGRQRLGESKSVVRADEV